MDTDVINTQWFVDGQQKGAFDGKDTFSLAGWGLSQGQHTIRLRAFDPTGFDPTDGWVRINTSMLEQIVNWNVMIAVPEPGTIVLAVVAMACGAAATTRKSSEGALGDQRWLRVFSTKSANSLKAISDVGARA